MAEVVFLMGNKFVNSRDLPKENSNWSFLKFVTANFRSLILVGAGNHYGLIPTIIQIAQEDLNCDRFKVIGPYFDCKAIEDSKFEELLNKPYSLVFKEAICDDEVVIYNGFPNCYIVRRSFLTPLGVGIRLDFKNSVAIRISKLHDEIPIDKYRSLLARSSNLMSSYDYDFDHRFPTSELLFKFSGHLSKNANKSGIVVRPIDYFYQTFDLPKVRWLNLNQDGILEKNVRANNVVSYHGNVCLAQSRLVLPGYTGPVDIAAKEKAEDFMSEAQVIISLGYSFSDYDHDVLDLIARSKIKTIIIFDINAEQLCRNLKSYYKKSKIIPRRTFLPLFPHC